MQNINIFPYLLQRQAVLLGTQPGVFSSSCQLLQPKDLLDIFSKDLFFFNIQQENKNKSWTMNEIVEETAKTLLISAQHFKSIVLKLSLFSFFVSNSLKV